MPGKADAIVSEHSGIVDAIARGDPKLAERRGRQHLSGTMATLEAIRSRYPEYVVD